MAVGAARMGNKKPLAEAPTERQVVVGDTPCTSKHAAGSSGYRVHVPNAHGQLTVWGIRRHTHAPQQLLEGRRCRHLDIRRHDFAVLELPRYLPIAICRGISCRKSCRREKTIFTGAPRSWFAISASALTLLQTRRLQFYALIKYKTTT